MRRTLGTTAATAVTVALTASLAVGCGALDKALDCANTAVTIAGTVDDLQQAVSGATEDPQAAREALTSIDKNLDKLQDETDDGDVSKAVKDMATAVDDARTDIEQGRSPDVGPVGDAADDLTNVCSPG
ncbi:hypothetical protein LHJ74_15185 [Streptomyces sp. N2-109]|uniref:Secreted protein n=1 Tax=Streptomyces gossypii TaxID=2883101 RepID=A0ABT2JVB9_9ACTN|nr:hypothetical protein [Streptomyces gossypii]MCT2591234.1 hypothetical protein [Streptomyces gossypii]